MGLRRWFFALVYKCFRLVIVLHPFRCLVGIVAITTISFLIISVQLQDSPSSLNVQSERAPSQHRWRLNVWTRRRYNESFYKRNRPKSFFKRNLNRNQSSQNIIVDRSTRYSFVDVESLGVNMDHLEDIYQPPDYLEIPRPSARGHYRSRIAMVKGDSSVIFYNRLPHSYEFTMRGLLQNLSFGHSYKYIASQIYIPFSYDDYSLVTIGRSLTSENASDLLYERHIYFFDFLSLQLPSHPVWINLVSDPIYRLAVEYNRSREICLKNSRCFVRKELLGDTLDECVSRHSPRHCVSTMSGISRMLPFFCGLNNATLCEQEDDVALEQAKKNIEDFYTVIGVADDFYRFLYVLEKLLPRYFKLARLLFMNIWDPKGFADPRDTEVQYPQRRTVELIEPFLRYEYKLYEFIKGRFVEQYQIFVELDG